MPLVIRNGCPTVVCDHCGEDIKSADDGNYQWVASDGDAAILFTHKECCHSFEMAHGRGSDGVHFMANELRCLPIYLGNSLFGGTARGWDNARKTVVMLASI